MRPNPPAADSTSTVPSAPTTTARPVGQESGVIKGRGDAAFQTAPSPTAVAAFEERAFKPVDQEPSRVPGARRPKKVPSQPAAIRAQLSPPSRDRSTVPNSPTIKSAPFGASRMA